MQCPIFFVSSCSLFKNQYYIYVIDFIFSFFLMSNTSILEQPVDTYNTHISIYKYLDILFQNGALSKYYDRKFNIEIESMPENKAKKLDKTKTMQSFFNTLEQVL